MTEGEESAYVQGQQTLALAIFRSITPYLPKGTVERDAAALRIERAEAIVALRDICREHGDSEWPDDMHIADIINKHLSHHL